MIRYETTRAVVFFTMLLLSSMALPAIAQVSFSKTNHALQTAPFKLVAADVNGDDRPDLVVLSVLGGNVSIFLNNGDGTFASSIDSPAATNPPDFTGGQVPSFGVADFNGDKRLDVVVVNAGNPPAASVSLLLGNGDGTFQPPRIDALDFTSVRLVGVEDFNGDKKPDVAMYGENDHVSVFILLGKGDGTFDMSPRCRFLWESSTLWQTSIKTASLI